jgi:ATP-dependent protease ClpP protease subunit
LNRAVTTSVYQDTCRSRSKGDTSDIEEKAKQLLAGKITILKCAAEMTGKANVKREK